MINVTPRDNGQGSLGTPDKKWKAVYAEDYIDGEGDSIKDKIDAVVGSSAIIGSGDNYVRWANGFQICWDIIGVQQVVEGNGYGTTSWTYPMAFNGTPVIFVSSTSDRLLLAAGDETATSATVKFANTTSYNNYLESVKAIAVGRWK